ncbi:hypothetical protein ACFL1B_04105 [Nanoarchaeota archaeon]
MKHSALLMCLVLLAACTGNGTGEDYKPFYKGHEGVSIVFMEDAPPRDLFYKGQEVSFPVGVLVSNRGASMARGAVFISGYDPTVLSFEEVDENKGFFDMCDFDIQRMTFAGLTGSIHCKRIGLGNENTTGLNLWSLLNNALGSDIFSWLRFDRSTLQMNVRDDGSKLDVRWNDPAFQTDLDSRGMHFLGIWSAYDFSLNQGKEFLLHGDTPFYPKGEEEFLQFKGKVVQIPASTTSTTQHVLVTACYLYSTQVGPFVCIESADYSESESECNPAGYESETGQGGPIAITSITQKSTGSQNLFRITIENMGSGTVYNPMRMFSCSPNNPEPVTEEDVGLVVLGSVYIGDQRLECYPQQNTIRLNNGVGYINCVYDVTGAGYSKTGYETQLLVDLWYGYSETIRSSIRIQRV